jgi:hypothetical protein
MVFTVILVVAFWTAVIGLATKAIKRRKPIR